MYTLQPIRVHHSPRPCFKYLLSETDPVLASHFTINRWCEGRPFKQLQEATIHLDARRLHRWVWISKCHMCLLISCTWLITVTDLKARTHTHTHTWSPPLFWFAGNDLNMACERARVTIDEAPSSPVTHKVRLCCFVTSLHWHIPASTACDAAMLVLFFLISHSYVCVCSPVWRRVWRCSTHPLKCFTTPTAGGSLMPSTSERAAPSSRLRRGTCWESSSCRWEADRRKSSSAGTNNQQLPFITNRNVACIFCNVTHFKGKFWPLLLDRFGWQSSVSLLW